MTSVGMAIETLGEGIAVGQDMDYEEDPVVNQELGDLQEEQEGQEEEEELNNDFIDILTISMDSAHLRDWIDFVYTGLNIH